jgi:phytoene dehydrogenase-like protein
MPISGGAVMADYDVIVIGAGNGGLTAAATLAKSGVRVLLLERHNIPGGCATSFCRGRFEFEVSLHQLSGLGTAQQPGPLRVVLNSLGVLDKLEFVQMKDLYRIMGPDNLDIVLPADRAGTVNVLQKRFPDEKEAISRFFDLVYKFFNEVIGAFYLKDPDVSREKYPLYFKYAFKSAKSVIDEYFKDPLLKLALGIYWSYMGLPPRLLSFSDYAALYFAYMEFKPYHIKGGSQALSNAIIDSFLASGGEVRFNCAVEKIVVKEGAVKAVVTEHGDEISAGYIVSNASPITTFVDMIGTEHFPASLMDSMRGSTVSTSFITIFAGLGCEPETVGITETTNFICASTDMERQYELSKTLDCDESSLILSCYDKSDPDFSPAGACQVAIVAMKYAEPWLRVPAGEYYREKYRCADAMLRSVERHFPGLRDNIEEIEVATPLTHMRFLGQPGGSPYGFDHHLKDSAFFMPHKLPIKGLYGAGAWYGEPGYQPTLTSGTRAARSILKEMKA